MARTKYGNVISDKMLSTTWGEHIFSCIDDAKDIENGWVGFLGELAVGKEIYELLEPTTATIDTEELILVDQPAEVYQGFSKADFRDEYFINEAGISFRCRKPRVGDVFSITDYTIDPLSPTDGVQAGNFVVAQDGSHRLKEVAAPTGTEVFVGKIIDFKSTGVQFASIGLNFGGGSTLRYASIQTIKNTKV